MAMLNNQMVVSTHPADWPSCKLRLHQPSTSGISQRGFEARQPDDRRCHSSPIRPSQPDRNAGRCANLLGRNYLPWRWGWGFQRFSWQWWSQRHEMLGYDRKQWTSALDRHSNGRFDVSTPNCQDTKSRSKSRSDGLDFQMPTLDQPCSHTFKKHSSDPQWRLRTPIIMDSFQISCISSWCSAYSDFGN